MGFVHPRVLWVIAWEVDFKQQVLNVCLLALLVFILIAVLRRKLAQLLTLVICGEHVMVQQVASNFIVEH